MKASPLTTSANARAIPMIPGLLSSQRNFIGRTDFRKGQLMEQMAHGKDATTEPEEPSGKWLNVSNPPAIRDNKSSISSTTAKSNQIQSAELTQSTKYRKDPVQPKWITHDRQVLRFFGYFEEHASPHDDRNTPQLRVRRLVLFFYLTDHSISITEPRVANSGIPQGEFLKRSVVAKPNGAKYEPEDFHIGGHVQLCGRKIHLVDCDEATRTYYEEAVGQPLDTPRRYPDDHSSQIDEIEMIKQKLKQKTAALTESSSERVRKFHENSQKVLRFYVSWQDPHPLYPETRKYVLHYYLSDDTMEIIEPKVERDGRGHFAVLLTRRKMVSDDNKDHYIQHTDLRCGDYVHVFARRFLLEDCDEFTRSYYLDYHGVTQEKHEPVPVQHRGKAAKWKLFEVKPHEILESMERGGDRRLGGVSSDDASHQFYQNDAMEKKQLRFRARFHGLPASDPNASREFVLTFYLEDDTLSVFEPRVKNSGVVGGRFLDRGRFRKCCELVDGGTASREQEKAKSMYKASDFYVGAIVSFEFAPHQRLELIEADRQTLLFCESHPQRFPFSDAQAVLATVSRTVSSNTRLSIRAVRRECRVMDTTRSGVLNTADTKRLMQLVGVLNVLNAQQVVTLCHQFEDDVEDTKSPTRHFVYDDFCDTVAVETSKASPGGDSKDVYARLRKCTGLRRRLREIDRDRLGAVDASALTQLAAAFKVPLSSTDSEEISRSYASKRKGMIEYNGLCDRIFDGAAVSTDIKGAPQSRARDNYSYQDEYDSERHPQHSLRHQKQTYEDEENEFDGLNDDDGDACAPPTQYHPQPTRSVPPRSPRRQQVPALPLTRVNPPSTTSVPPGPRLPSSTPQDARVVALVRRVFGDRKYQLRKAFRERDYDKSGFLGEEAFMEAVTAVEPKLSDDDTYVIADAYFPTNNSQVDYGKLLESAFRG